MSHDLIIFHLSDFHINLSKNFASKFEALKRIFNGIERHTKVVLLVISGDIAQSGKKEEYDIALKLFLECKQFISRHSPTTEVKIIVSPGNHDVDFSTGGSLRDRLLDDFKSFTNTIGTDELTICTNVQNQYFEFSKQIMPDCQFSNPIDKIVCPYILNLGNGHKLTINIINTSWCSRLPEKQGSIILPIESIKNKLKQEGITITLMHHPFFWFDPWNGKELQKLVENNSHLILTGHQHYPDQYNKKSMSSGKCGYFVEAAPFWDQVLPAGFSRIDINQLESKIKITNYEMSHTGDDFIGKQSFEMPLDIIYNQKRHVFGLSDEMESWLQDPGTGFSHSQKDLLLDDLYVFPSLVKIEGSSAFPKTIPEDDFLEILNLNDSVLIFGGELTGKTTFAKRLFSDLHNSGFVPLRITGKDLLGIKEDHPERILAKLVQDQYEGKKYDDWLMLSIEKRIIVIDDYHLLHKSSAFHIKLIENLKSLTHKIIIFANILMKFEEVVKKAGTSNPFSSFIQLDIRPFSKSKKKQLIRKWLHLGAEDMEDVMSEEYRIESTLQLIESIISRDLMPSFPLFILTVLQIIESQTSLQTNSFGEIYDVLTKQRLAKMAIDITPDTRETFLAEFAWALHLNQTEPIQSVKLSEVHVQYYKYYGLSFQLNEFLKEAINLGILSETNGSYCFKYPYQLAFFIAKAIQIKLGQPDLNKIAKQVLTDYISSIHRELASNVVMFYLYLSRDVETLNQMLESAEDQYKKLELFTFDIDVKPLCGDDLKVPELSISQHILEPSDEESEDIQDEYSKDGRDHNGHPVNIEKEEINELIQINKAFKTIQVLGQTLRIFPGSLSQAIKIDIAEKAILLGLRVMKFVFTCYKDNVIYFKEDIKNNILKKLKDTPESLIDDVVNRRLANLTLYLSVCGIRKVSQYVGSPHCDILFPDILRKNNNPAINMIELTVSLEHYRPLRLDTIRGTFLGFKDDFVLLYAGKMITYQHMALHTLPHQEGQALCNIAGIDYIGTKQTEQNKEDIIDVVNRADKTKIVSGYLKRAKAMYVSYKDN